MTGHNDPLGSQLHKTKVFNGTESVSVDMEKDSALQHVINLIESSLRKREATGSVTRENYEL